MSLRLHPGRSGDKMKIRFELNGEQYESATSNGISIAIPMDFEGPQPNHFGAPKACRSALEMDGFVGDTNRGGSCNVDTLTMVPHCNGTHSESIGHIVNEDVYVGHQVFDAFTTATLVTVEADQWQDVGEKHETYRPPLDATDWVITAARLEHAFNELGIHGTTSLIVRTNSRFDKKSVAYGSENQPPFFTVEAMKLIVERNYRHLLVDTPSVDRMYDEGLLTNHHIFWNVTEGTHELNVDGRQDKTITEMVLVDVEVADGLYLLNLQVPSLCTDAAPSRPVIYKTNRV